MRRPLLLAVVALAVAAVAVWYLRSGGQSVPTAVVGRGRLQQTIETTGTLEPVTTMTVRGRAAGVVSLFAIKPGDHIEQGDIVAEIDRGPYQTALGAATRARDLAELAQTAAEAAASATPGIQDRFNAIAAAQKVADANAALDAAQRNLDATTVIAPAAGTVLDVAVNQGDPYQAGAPLFTLSANTLQVAADLDEVDVPRVPTGTAVTLVADAFPSVQLKGRVATVAPAGTQRGGGTVFPATITLDDTGGAALRPGMSVSVTIPSAVAENATLVPDAAVKTVGRRSFVTVERDGKEVTVEVMLGLRANGQVEIAAGDVRPGERVRLES